MEFLFPPAACDGACGSGHTPGAGREPSPRLCSRIPFIPPPPPHFGPETPGGHTHPPLPHPLLQAPDGGDTEQPPALRGGPVTC